MSDEIFDPVLLNQTSGSCELCRSGVPHERAARLQASGTGTFDVSLSSAEGGARRRHYGRD